jgi:hypothetical protein
MPPRLKDGQSGIQAIPQTRVGSSESRQRGPDYYIAA